MTNASDNKRGRRASETRYTERCNCGSPTVNGLHWWGWRACQNYRTDRRIARVLGC